MVTLGPRAAPTWIEAPRTRAEASHVTGGNTRERRTSVPRGPTGPGALVEIGRAGGSEDSACVTRTRGSGSVRRRA